MKHTKHLLVLWAALLLGAGNAWGAEFSQTYSYGLTDWSLTNYSDKSSYYLVPNSGTSSVATISGIFTGKTITSNVVITINCATYGSGTNPSANTFAVYTASDCATAVTATQGGTLPTSSTYKDVTYTITQSEAAKFTDDLAIQITKPGKQIRLKSIKVVFTYETGTPPTTPLVAPQNLSVSNVTSTTVDLSWDAVTNATGYIVTYIDESDVTKTKDVNGTTTTLEGLSANTTYSWTVTAVDNSGTYSNSSAAAGSDFTTAAAPKYTITWMSNNSQHAQTQVTQGEAITTLPTEPVAPSSCSDKVFMGWTAAPPVNADGTGITYITAETVPTKDEIYYAVFATATTTGGGTPTAYTAGDVGQYVIATISNGKYYALPNNPTVSSGKITGTEITVTTTGGVPYVSTTNAVGYTWTIANASYGQTISDGSNYIYHSNGGASGTNLAYGTSTTNTWKISQETNGLTFIGMSSSTSNNTRGMLCRGTTFGGYSLSNEDASGYNRIVVLPIAGSTTTYSDYITQCDNSKAMISYDYNGGNGTCTSGTVTKGDNYVICSEGPSRTGYTFNGWSDGTNTYGTGETITNVQANITLTAQWQANIYTITFDANGGSVTPTTVDYTYDGAVVAMPTPTRDGFRFEGWYTEQTGGTKWEDVGNTNKPTSNITLYAHWSELYSATFIANGQTFVTQTDKYCSGDALQLPATDPDAGTYACAGYTFVGWASDEQSGATTTCPTLVSASTPITADATFHAVWKKRMEAAMGLYHLVTDAANLTVGSSIIIAASDYDYAISTTQNSNNRGQSAITKDDATKTLSAVSAGVQILTLEAGTTTGTYAFYTGSGYLYAASSSSNYLKTETTLSANSSWAITITSAGIATCTAQGTNTRNLLKYNSSSSIFSCYSSGQNAIAIYQLSAGTAYYTTSPKCCPVNLQNPVVSTSVADGSVTLNWTMPADAGKVTDYTVTCVGGVTADITETSYTFTGLTNCTEYTFTVRANGDGTAVCPSEVVTVKATPAADSFTVTFDYGAGAGTPASWTSGCGNTSVTLPEPTTLPDNHTFEGWYDGTTLYASGDTYTPTADITLTARYTKKAGVDVVEWDPNSVTVEIGVGGAAQVQIENEVTSGSGTGKVADNLFFSKYYESTNSVKLLAVFNGTAADIDLSNFRIRMNAAGASTCSGTSNWSSTISLSGTLESGKEYIIYSEGTKKDIDAEVMACAKANHAAELATWHSDTKVSFSGNDAIILEQNTGSWNIIDIIGAGNASAANLGDDCSVGVINATGSFMDAPGWYNADGESIENGSKIALSTNRCLLVRKNTVTSGAIAVAKNTEDFVTLGGAFGEWVGKQIPNGSDKGVSASCEGFDFVGTYDYNGYYTTYQELTKVDLGGNQNADGTYTIQVSGLDDISCSKIRINVLDGSSSSPLVSSEYKVPIMVNASGVTTTNAIFTKHKVADCSECDVVVLKGATLEKAPDGTAGDRNEFRDMEVYAGGKLKVPSGATDLKVNKLVMRSKGDEVPVAEITGTITIADKLYHAKRIDAARFYFFTLPYDCNVADITYYNGEVLSGNGDGYLIKYYDGAGRAIGQNAGHWEVYTGSLLEAGKGYIVAISASLNGSFESNPKKELLFPMTNALSETTTKTVAVGTYGVGNASIGDNHKGWNLIGCPFMSNYSPIDATGLKVGTYEDGTWDDGGKIFTYNPSVTIPYVTMPNTDGKTYTQKLASSQDLQPFRSFFVQVGKVGNIISDVAFSSANRKAPRKAPAADAAVWVELTLSNASGSDATTVIVDDDKTTDYEIGADLEKMLGRATLPQLYSLKSGIRLAFNALPSASASGAVPLGFYAPASDTYTIAMNTTQAYNLEGVYLTDNVTGTVTNLLLDDYSFASGATWNESRFSLAVVRSATAVDNVLLGAVTPVVHRRTLRIDNAPVGSLVRVYDTLGREVVSEQIDAETVVYQLQMPGVYHVQIFSKDSKSVYKVVSY